jgi:hypothetical protein
MRDGRHAEKWKNAEPMRWAKPASITNSRGNRRPSRPAGSVTQQAYGLPVCLGCSLPLPLPLLLLLQRCRRLA